MRCFYMPVQWVMPCLQWAAGEKMRRLPSPGHKSMFDGDSLVTVWSAPNYCYRRVAAAARVNEFFGGGGRTTHGAGWARVW